MKTDQLIERITQDIYKPNGQDVRLKPDEAKLLLERVNHLESVAAALLRSNTNAEAVVLPYRDKPIK